MARIGVGGLHHETNSFAPHPADWEAFDHGDGWPARQRGRSMFAGIAGINLAITGFVDRALARGHELVPLMWANACPSGPVTTDAFERLSAQMLEDLAAAGPLDGIFLDLHGAMITEEWDDGEGELLRRIRGLCPGTPIVAALDLHANVSDAMVDLTDGMVAYRTYPHIDIAETGERCLPLLERLIAGQCLFKSHVKLDVLIGLPWQCTTIEPAQGLYRLADALAARTEGFVSVAMGFPPGDTSCGGPSILAYGADPARVQAASAELVQAFAAAEPLFAGKLWSAQEAVEEALRRPWNGQPVLLADTQDNPGGGGTSDTTGLLAALHRREGAGRCPCTHGRSERRAGCPCHGSGRLASRLPSRRRPWTGGGRSHLRRLVRAGDRQRQVHRDRRDVSRQPNGTGTDGTVTGWAARWSGRHRVDPARAGGRSGNLPPPERGTCAAEDPGTEELGPFSCRLRAARIRRAGGGLARREYRDPRCSSRACRRTFGAALASAERTDVQVGLLLAHRSGMWHPTRLF